MKILTLILLSLFSYQSFAQSDEDIQYVTGKLYLSLYEQADSGSTVLKSLVSGDRLNVIEIAGPYAKVVTDKDKEGWVKKGFLVKTKPAAILYKETDVALKELQKKIALKEESNHSIEQMTKQLDALQEENKELNLIKELYLQKKEKEKENLSEAVSNNSENKIDLAAFIAFIEEYTLFLLATFLLLVLIGFRLGELKTESEVIKHFGGVKVW